MILVDSSIWIDHIRSPQPEMTAALTIGRVLQHPFVTAEIALGSIKDRKIIAMLHELPQVSAVSQEQLLEYVEHAALPGTGVGMVDAHLLASAAGLEGASIWTRDKRLAAQAERLGLAFKPQ